MCEKCRAKKEVMQAMGLLKVVEVGTVSPELLQAYNDHMKNKGLQELDLDMEVLQLRRKYILGELDDAAADLEQDRLNAAYNALNTAAKAEHAELWENVYMEMGIVGKARDNSHTINQETGKITAEEAQDGALGKLFGGDHGLHVSIGFPK